MGLFSKLFIWKKEKPAEPVKIEVPPIVEKKKEEPKKKRSPRSPKK